MTKSLIHLFVQLFNHPFIDLSSNDQTLDLKEELCAQALWVPIGALQIIGSADLQPISGDNI